MRYAISYITLLTITITFIALIITINGCDKEEKDYPIPDIQFLSSQNYVFNDTSLLLNDTVYLGIIAKTRSDVELVHFNITTIKDSIITSIDTGIFANKFEYRKRIIKGLSEFETWSFYVRDRDGRKSNIIDIIFDLDTASSFGNINFIQSIIFGAQNHGSIGSFYSFSTEQIYVQAEAFNNQEKINLLYFYDLIEAEDNTISSPGANIDNSVFPGATGLTNWTERNTTRFEYRGELSPTDFDHSTNDSLILANTFEFASGKRKAKNLAAGNIYSFVTETGIKGMFKVTDVQNEEAGTIEISIKMQE